MSKLEKSNFLYTKHSLLKECILENAVEGVVCLAGFIYTGLRFQRLQLIDSIILLIVGLFIYGWIIISDLPRFSPNYPIIYLDRRIIQFYTRNRKHSIPRTFEWGNVDYIYFDYTRLFLNPYPFVQYIRIKLKNGYDYKFDFYESTGRRTLLSGQLQNNIERLSGRKDIIQAKRGRTTIRRW